jgi:hypothetical protein
VKIFYDTEFLENGSTIRLISIGMVREDGKGIYRVVYDYTLLKDVWNHDWLRRNVFPSLPYQMTEDGIAMDHSHLDYKEIASREEIAADIKRFVLDTPNPELWAYYSAYDHVALCQLYGRMLDLPTGFPMFSYDLKAEIMRLGNPQVPEQATGAHNAYMDALWNKETYEYLQGYRPRTAALRALQDQFDRGSRD